jgi:hypothetical protein
VEQGKKRNILPGDLQSKIVALNMHSFAHSIHRSDHELLLYVLYQSTRAMLMDEEAQVDCRSGCKPP